ncbi:Pentatricopeptide repeat-containing protein [Nymphaea thermarum]|nr:Pentatricopeptide repeat-containing protein [Nymphaea thermarum]
MHFLGKQALLLSSHRHLPLPSSSTFCSFFRIPLLQCLTASSSLSQIQQAHAHLCKLGIWDQLASIIVTLYARHQRYEDCLCVFVGALSSGVPPDHFALPSAIKSCSALLALSVGRQIHNLVLVNGFDSDSFILSSLIGFYVKCGELQDAHRLFGEMPIRTLVSWSSLIAGYARKGRADEAESLLMEMRAAGIEPNVVTWNGLITGHAQSGYFLKAVTVFAEMLSEGFKPDGSSVSCVLPAVGHLDRVLVGKQIHAYVMMHGLDWDICVVSALVDMYGKCRCIEDMRAVFDETPHKDVGLYNALVSGFSRNGLVDDALMVFREIESQGLKLNVISWTSMVACCSQNGKDLEALELFREMQNAGVQANSVTIPCLLPACANIAAVQHGRAIHCFSLRRLIAYDVYVGSALIDMYAKCGRIADAQSIFDAMPLKNLVSWNAIIGGYGMNGMAKEALQLFQAMLRSRQKPDSITFTCVLSACSQRGLTEEGQRCFESMSREHCILAKTEHYACMVSLLGRVGKLDDAYSLILNMPIKPDACVWGALLSSCRVHGDVDLGEIAAEHLFELEPRNAGNYVLLSNIYAAVGRWDKVDKVRDIMKSIGLKKNPGGSWIQINNMVHALLAGDKSHPQMNELIGKLESLGMAMRKAGYLPDTNFVLHDIEEQDKEHILCGHSEKLAVALGLLNTQPGMPLRIIKNLRICVTTRKK